MREGIHPEYRPVLFRDTAAGFEFITGSTIKTSQTGVFVEDGKEYPLALVEISSASHPFYTGKMKLVDTAGRVEKFRRKYGIKAPEDE